MGERWCLAGRKGHWTTSLEAGSSDLYSTLHLVGDRDGITRSLQIYSLHFLARVRLVAGFGASCMLGSSSDAVSERPLGRCCMLLDARWSGILKRILSGSLRLSWGSRSRYGPHMCVETHGKMWRACPPRKQIVIVLLFRWLRGFDVAYQDQVGRNVGYEIPKKRSMMVGCSEVQLITSHPFLRPDVTQMRQKLSQKRVCPRSNVTKVDENMLLSMHRENFLLHKPAILRRFCPISTWVVSVCRFRGSPTPTQRSGATEDLKAVRICGSRTKPHTTDETPYLCPARLSQDLSCSRHSVARDDWMLHICCANV